MLRRCAFPALSFLSALALPFALLLAPEPASAQQQQPNRDLVANFAAGRVEICVAKETMLIATADIPVEPGSEPPLIFGLGTGRLGILLGAASWIEPGTGRAPDQFAQDLISIGHDTPAADTIAPAGNEAGDIEMLGIALLERIRAQAEAIHHKINLSADEPLVELIIADYIPGYGFEAWLVSYKITQESIGNDFWETRVTRPDYTQLYPPEKGQPRTLVEVRYPPALEPTLLDRLERNDPDIDSIRSASPQLNQATSQILAGQSPKSIPADDADFLRAAMPVITRANAKLSLVEITDDRDIVWVVGESARFAAPPPAPGEKPAEPDAPSLYKH
jgi:hypothetical protein